MLKRYKRYSVSWGRWGAGIAVGFVWLGAGSASIPPTLAEGNEEAQPAGAILEFLQSQLDLGTVRVADLKPFRKEIEFINRGDQPLILSHVRGCCGTRITEWPRAPIMPEEQGHIEIQFSLASRPHTVRRTITVTSNATVPSQVHRIVGQIVADEPVAEAPGLGPQLVFNKASLDMGVVAVDNSDSLNLDICFENQGDKPLLITQVRGRGMVIERWPTDPVLPGQSGSIVVQIVPEQEGGAFSRYLFVISNDPVRRHTYRVRGQWAAP